MSLRLGTVTGIEEILMRETGTFECAVCGHKSSGLVHEDNDCLDCPLGDGDKYDGRRVLECQYCCSTWASLASLTKHVGAAHPQTV